VVLAGSGACAMALGLALVLQPAALHVTEAAVGAGPVSAGPAAPAPDPTPLPGAAAPAGGGDAPPPADVAVSPPVHLEVAAVDVAAEVVPAGVLPDGALDVPPDPRVVGWWSSGAVPGAASGTVVLAAHVDASGFGAGPMVRLVDAPLGTTVQVDAADGTSAAYEVVERRAHPKSEGIPRDVYRADGPHRLVLITCGGVFDARAQHYRDNVVLVAATVER
jgi:Sortase domain